MPLVASSFVVQVMTAPVSVSDEVETFLITGGIVSTAGVEGGGGGSEFRGVHGLFHFSRYTTRIETSADLLPHVRHYADRKQEHFLCASINGANEILNIRVVSIGLIDRTPVHPREVFAEALSDRASAIIVAHNHPGRKCIELVVTEWGRFRIVGAVRRSGNRGGGCQAPKHN